MRCRVRLFNIILASGLAFFASCGERGPAAGTPEEVLFLLRERGGQEDVLDLYSSETISSMKEYMDASGMDMRAAVNTLSFIAEDAQYITSDLKMEGNRCSLNLKFLNRGPEKSRGLVLAVVMVKEEGGWRIDRSDDFRELLNTCRQRGAEKYLERIR